MSSSVITESIIRGTAAKRATYNTAGIDPKMTLVWEEEDTNRTYKWTGRVWVALTDNGAAYTRFVGEGPLTLSRDRELATLTTARESATWILGENVTSMVVTLVYTGHTTSTPENALCSAVICFDAPSDGVADTWLTAGDHTLDNSMLKRVMLNVPRVFDFSSPQVRIDAKATYLATDATVSLMIEAN